MKKNVLSLMLLSFMAVSLFSCSKDDEDFDVQVGIIGEWSLASADILIEGKSMQEYAKDAGISEEQLEFFDFSEFESETKFDFQENGVLVMKDSEGEMNSSWSADKKTLTITEGDYDIVYNVKSLSDTKAVLSYKDESHVYGDFNIESILTLKK
ncbi:hypothetical protein WJR50_02855 [Catalinimonas sp. 4WD22]|uniref:hypothetical protein n=1 Tax=Catalinimonas locisalis TaxID=3133978 RepID=UPI0031015CC7